LFHLRALFVACGAALLLAVTAGSVSAASSVRTGSSTVSVSTDTTVIRPETRAINATIRIVTRKKGLRFELGFESNQFARQVGGRPLREGSTLRFAGLQTITGPFRTNGSGSSFGGGGVCNFASVRGGNDGPESVDAEIPANSEVTLVARFELVGDAPWANTNYSPRIRVTRLRSYPGSGNRQTNRSKWDYFSKTTVLTVPRPLIAIPLAARIDLDFSPKLVQHWWGLGTLPAGKTLEVTGTLVPTRVGYPINLWIDGRRLKETFLTDANGQIRYRFKPDSGYTARIRAGFLGMPGADLLPDPGCEMSVDVASAKKGQK
jgi:hypothetical protein